MNSAEEAATRAAIRSMLSDIVPQIVADARTVPPKKAPPRPNALSSKSDGAFGPPSVDSGLRTRSPAVPPAQLPHLVAAENPPDRPSTGAFTSVDSVAAHPGSARHGPQPLVDAGGDVVHVSVEDDRELSALVFDVLRYAENPRRREDIRTGRLTFRLSGSQGSASPVDGTVPGYVRVDKGALTERMVQAAAGTGSGFIIGRGASVTPLAAESARQRGITIEREK